MLLEVGVGERGGH